MAAMKIKDRIYGEIELAEPVLEELIASPSLQRLKWVDQAGYFEPYFPGTAHSRFEHSVGVCLLLRQYQAAVAEQIAGLIHDVSHAAFSHCIDYVLDNGTEGTQSHQDDVHESYVKKSEIPGILVRHGYDTDYILDDANFPLKEKELPDLCADRLDYSLRGAVIFGDLEDADYFLDYLKARDGRWFFADYDRARDYARLFKYLNDNYYSGLPTAVMFRTVGDYLKFALQQGYIAASDLYTTDRAVLDKIAPHHQHDPHLSALFERMNNRVPFKNDPQNFDAAVVCKSRIVDPPYLADGRLQRLSDSDISWQQELEEGRIPKKYFIKFEQ